MGVDSSNEYILQSEVEWYFESPLDSDVTTADFVLRKVQLHATNGRTSCITNGNTGETYKYADLESMSRKIASALYKIGFRKGDTVVYSPHDATKLHIFMLGVWRANGIVRSSYPEDVQGELAERVLESEARWILCDDDRAEEHLAFAKSFSSWPITVITIGRADGCLSIDELLQDDGKELPNCETGQEDIALILPTSGTTGKSKGAIYDHKTLINVIIAYQNFPFTDKPEEAFLSTSRATHFTGSVNPLAFFTAGRHLIMLPKCSVEIILETITKHKVYGIMSMPKNLVNIVNYPKSDNYDLTNLTYVSSCSQTIDTSVVTTIKKIPSVKQFFVFYGMTEAGIFTASIDYPALKKGILRDLGAFPAYNVGKLFPGIKLKVCDLENGKSLGVGEKGELVFHCPIMCSGYLKKPKETENTFRNGWIHTGDIGYYNEEGWIFLVDRDKETFKYFNNHIYPTELENILLSHKAIAEACVVGVPAQDGGDRVPRAFLVLKNSSETTKKQEIMEFFNERVASYKQLRGGIYFLASLPVAKTGKVVRRMVAELAVAQEDQG